MSTVARPVVLSDVLPIPKVAAKSREVVLVVGFALLVAALSQLEFSISWTDSPITLGTLGVLLAGGVLGSRLGAFSVLLYVVAGFFLPIYADGEKGWATFSGDSAGTYVGFIVAAYVVGLLAERKEDRSYLTSIAAMLLGSAIIFLVGTPWLAHSAGISAQAAIDSGVLPFVVGSAVTATIAGVLLTTAWSKANK